MFLNIWIFYILFLTYNYNLLFYLSLNFLLKEKFVDNNLFFGLDIDIKVLIIFVIVLILILLMVYAIYKLKKEI